MVKRHSILIVESTLRVPCVEWLRHSIFCIRALSGGLSMGDLRGGKSSGVGLSSMALVGVAHTSQHTHTHHNTHTQQIAQFCRVEVQIIATVCRHFGFGLKNILNHSPCQLHTHHQPQRLVFAHLQSDQFKPLVQVSRWLKLIAQSSGASETLAVLPDLLQAAQATCRTRSSKGSRHAPRCPLVGFSGSRGKALKSGGLS